MGEFSGATLNPDLLNQTRYPWRKQVVSLRDPGNAAAEKSAWQKRGIVIQ